MSIKYIDVFRFYLSSQNLSGRFRIRHFSELAYALHCVQKGKRRTVKYVCESLSCKHPMKKKIEIGTYRKNYIKNENYRQRAEI